MSSNRDSWSEPASEARQRWHTEARERDDAYLATLPHDDSEHRDLFAAGDPSADGRPES